jgi:DNA-binding NarL/FixJ family response regulator
VEKVDVLIAEHQRNIRQGLKALLKLSPIINQIWEAGDGENAIMMIESLNPDLVITAAEMPMIGGLSVTRWIKKNRPEIKVILLTMYPYYEDEALAAGVNRFLVKGKEDTSIEEEIRLLFNIESGDVK